MIYFILVPIYIVAIVIAYFITKAIYKSRQRQNKPSWKINSAIWLIVFFGITWDWIPSEIYYAYQCSKLEPIKVYKTPEQWIKENQDLMQDLTSGKKITFKINSEEDIPLPEEGYKIFMVGSIEYFSPVVYVSYEENRLLRGAHKKQIIYDRYTGEKLISEISFNQEIRFDRPPEYSGSTTCYFNDKSSRNILDFFDRREVIDFYNIGSIINKKRGKIK